MATVAKSDRSTTITLASASAGPFDLTFRLFDDDGLDVYVNDQQVTNFAISSNYVDGYDDNATITFDASLQPGDVIRVDAALTPGRAVDYLDGPNLTYLQNIEFARIWSTLAELKRDSRRSVRFFDNVSPLALQAGRILLVNSDGNGIELGAQASDIPLAQGYAAEAKAWARTAEDTEVQPGEFSALHWAAKAAASAAEAATFDPANFYTKVQADANFLTPAAADLLYQAQNAALADIAGITGVQGDVLYFDGTNWVALPKGTAGQSLTMNSGATAPEWVDAPRTVDPNMQPQSVTLTKDVIYQNNTGYIMPVVFRDNATVAGSMQVSQDGSTWTTVATINASNTTEMGTFFVPPGWFYRSTVGNRDVIEWRA